MGQPMIGPMIPETSILPQTCPICKAAPEHYVAQKGDQYATYACGLDMAGFPPNSIGYDPNECPHEHTELGPWIEARCKELSN